MRRRFRWLRKHKGSHINVSEAYKEEKPSDREDELTDKNVRRLISFLSMKGLVNRKDPLILPESLIKQMGITIGRVILILKAVQG